MKVWAWIPEAYSEPYQTSTMKRFAKRIILDAWLESKYGYKCVY